MEQITTIYQLGKDSVKDISILRKNIRGYKMAQEVQKKGMKGDSAGCRLMFVKATMATFDGYDYVLITGERTNSGRWEPLRFSTRSVHIGYEKIATGYASQVRTANSYRTELCEGDVLAPQDYDPRLPKHYADLPKHPSMCRKSKSQPEPLPLETIEAEAVPEQELPFTPTPLMQPEEVQVVIEGETLGNLMDQIVEFIDHALLDPSSPFAIRLQSAILHIAARCLTKAACELTKGDLPK